MVVDIEEFSQDLYVNIVFSDDGDASERLSTGQTIEFPRIERRGHCSSLSAGSLSFVIYSLPGVNQKLELFKNNN